MRSFALCLALEGLDSSTLSCLPMFLRGGNLGGNGADSDFTNCPSLLLADNFCSLSIAVSDFDAFVKGGLFFLLLTVFGF